jgi:hypothetical protein
LRFLFFGFLNAFSVEHFLERRWYGCGKFHLFPVNGLVKANS